MSISKEYNLKHEALINCDQQPKEQKDRKEGNLCNHKTKVETIKIFQENRDNNGVVKSVTPVVLSKQFIVDLYNNIINIESKVISKHYDPDLPF